MAITEIGQYLNEYVAPQLLLEFRNYKDDFMARLSGAPARAITADGIRFNKLINNVGFYVDNTEDFVAKKMTGEKTFVPWEKYDTDPTEVDDAEIRALPYDKRSEVRKKHSESFKIGIRNHVLYKLAPEEHVEGKMPVIRTTGEVVGNRKRLTFADLVTFRELVKRLNLPLEDQMNLILCPEHSSDLLVDRDSAKDFSTSLFIDPISGKVRSFLGFTIFENNQANLYDATGKKKAEGAVAADGDQYSSTFFYGPNTVYHLNETKILYKPESIDTSSANPTSEFRTQTYGLVDRIVDYGFGAIISAPNA